MWKKKKLYSNISLNIYFRIRLNVLNNWNPFLIFKCRGQTTPPSTSYLIPSSFHTLILTSFFFFLVSTTNPLNMIPLLQLFLFLSIYQLKLILFVSISAIETPSQPHQISLRPHHSHPRPQSYMSLAYLRYYISLPQTRVANLII